MNKRFETLPLIIQQYERDVSQNYILRECYSQGIAFREKSMWQTPHTLFSRGASYCV